MEAAAIDADPMLRLLTEALRRGPGSPEWHKAVGDLRDTPTPAADEYRLLIAARERLESGRAYREVRAGPAFTRELFGKLEAGPAVRGRVPLGLFLRLLCLLTLVAAIGLLVVWAAQGRSDTAAALSGQLFVTPVHDWAFTGGPLAGLHRAAGGPANVGPDGLRAGSDKDAAARVTEAMIRPLVLKPGVCVEARVRVGPGPAGAALVLRDDPRFEGGEGDEISIACSSDLIGVNQNSNGRGAVLAPGRPLRAGVHVLRLKADANVAVADVDGQLLWSGPHGLGERAWPGVSVSRSGRGPAEAAVRSLRVLAP